MSQNIINEHTDENIKNYLSEEDEANKLKNEKQFASLVGNKKGKNSNKENNSKRNKKLIFAVLFLFLAVALTTAYFVYVKGQQSFDSEKVKIAINAPMEMASGEEIAFELEYKNNTGVKLVNPKIGFFPPENFIFLSSDKKAVREGVMLNWNIDDLLSGESGKIKLFGRIIGDKDSEHEFNSKISYKPANFNYEFQSADSLSKIKIKIISVSFDFSLDCPKETIEGNEIKCLIAYENISSHSFDKVKVRINLPKEFDVTETDPESAEKTENELLWEVGKIDPKKGGKMKLKGKLSGKNSKEKEIKTEIEAFGSNEELLEVISKKAVIKIREIPISIEQTVNALKNISVNKGEEIEYRIKFKNISGQEIRGLVVNNEVEGSIDIASLQVVNGSYDEKNNKMSWSAFNIPKLAVFEPEEEDEVSFKIKVKDYFDIKSSADKNFTIKNKVTINSFNFSKNKEEIETRLAFDEITTKINSFMFLRARGYFNDDGRIKNMGFVPPEVGKETTYTIHWNLSNLLGDAKNIKVISVLPENVKWKGNYIKSNGEVSLGDENNGTYASESNKPVEDLELEEYKKSEENKDKETFTKEEIMEEKFYYNITTREVIWEVPNLEANTGLSSPSKEVVFQISVIPKDDDVGKAIRIMNEVGATGFDEFTGENISTIESWLTTELPDDYSIGPEEGIVIKQ